MSDSDLYKKALSRFQNICSRKECCSKDILNKILKYTEDNREVSEKVLSSLQSDKYVDDLRYASAYAREKAHINGWGKVKIRYMLRAKGIDNDTILESFEDIDDKSADNKLYKIFISKQKSLADDPKAREKLIRYLMSRGYSYDDIKNLLGG